MAKKKCKINLIYCCVALLALVGLIMMFVTSVKLNGVLTGETEFTGLQATFGYTNQYDAEFFSFSFLNLLAYILLLAAFVLTLLQAFGGSKNKALDYAIICLFVVSAVLFFLMPAMSISPYANAANRLVEGSVTKTLGVGAILSAVLSLVSAFLLCAKTLMKK